MILKISGIYSAKIVPGVGTIRPVFIVFMVLALVVLGAICFYLGIRVQGVLTHFKYKVVKPAFWLIFIIAVIAVFVTRSPLICAVLYSVMLYAAGDIVKLLLRLIGSGDRLFGLVWQGGLTPLIISIIITVFAVSCAVTPVLKSYEITLAKPNPGLRIAMISDVHLGTAVRQNDLDAMIKNVNSIEPDIICLCGDIFEEGTSSQLRILAIEAMGGFKARYGVYFVSGNHDSVIPREEQALMRENGVTLLQDEAVLINDAFYLIGRADAGHAGDITRLPVAQLTQGIDTSLPVIVLDHRPAAYIEAQSEGNIDLQLSGHTHAAQLFPFGVISGLVNKINYGMRTFGDFNVIVSSGYGAWGAPIRTGSRSEYVEIVIS